MKHEKTYRLIPLSGSGKELLVKASSENQAHKRVGRRRSERYLFEEVKGKVSPYPL